MPKAAVGGECGYGGIIAGNGNPIRVRAEPDGNGLQNFRLETILVARRLPRMTAMKIPQPQRAVGLERDNFFAPLGHGQPVGSGADLRVGGEPIVRAVALTAVGGQQLMRPDAESPVVPDADFVSQAMPSLRGAAKSGLCLVVEGLDQGKSWFNFQQPRAIGSGVFAPSPDGAVRFAKIAPIIALKHLRPVRFGSQLLRREGSQARPPVGSSVIIKTDRAPAPEGSVGFGEQC